MWNWKKKKGGMRTNEEICVLGKRGRDSHKARDSIVSVRGGGLRSHAVCGKCGCQCGSRSVQTRRKEGLHALSRFLTGGRRHLFHQRHSGRKIEKKREKGKKRGISHENEEQQKSDDKKDLENKNTRKKREDEVDVERGSLEMAIAATFLQRDEIDIVPVATTSRRGCR